MKWKLWLIPAILWLVGMTACASHGYYAVRVPGPPPPPMAMGVRGYAPGPGYVWVDGFWDWRGGRWFWSGGQWMRPPRARAVWVPGRWDRGHDGYYFRRGYWR
jgi:hypothetical protein